MDNLLLLTDSYKPTHWTQYPPNTEYIYSYLEARGGPFPKTVQFGLQYILKKYFSKPITYENVQEAQELYGNHFGDTKLFNLEGWMHILNKHGGYLPLSIKAAPEGSIIDLKNVLMTIENTDPKCYWLTNYVETPLMQIWYPITVATISYQAKQIILKYLKETGDEKLIDFKLHDFGCRGVSSIESAGIGGAAHLVNFKGTDTVPALRLLRDYYDSNMAGFSIPASEHSTITSWGKKREAQAYANMIAKFGDSPCGLYAVVSDSYDIYNAVENIWGGTLKNKVIAAKGTLVIRPDSGEPIEVITRLLKILEEKFGTYTNSKSYKILNSVRLIQGDGVDLLQIERILEAVKLLGFSADNVSFGMGGGLLQKVNRDTFQFAIKCSNATIENKNIPVYKDPVTDIGKRSKSGKFKLCKGVGGSYMTVPESDIWPDELREVYRDGEILVIDSLDTIRERTNHGSH